LAISAFSHNRQHNTVPLRGPRQDGRIIGAGQPDILNANDVRLGFRAPNPTPHKLIPIRVGRPSQHVFRSPAPPPGQEALSDSGGIEAPLVGLANLRLIGSPPP
jgi:hypothetical protein